MIEMHCEKCGKLFSTYPSRIGRRKYCSKECLYVARGEIHRGPNSPSWKGGPVIRTCQICGTEFSIKRCNVKRGWGKFCSRQCLDVDFGNRVRGSGNPKWRGGIGVDTRNDPRYNPWRAQVYERDNWTCQDCGKPSTGNIVAHHMFTWRDFPEVRYEVWNGTTLCVDCHKARHYAAVAA